MNLYQVQDSDRFIYVIAASFQHAIELWRSQIMTETSEDCSEDEPEGVALIANHAGIAGKDPDFPEVIFPEDISDCM